MNNDMLDTSRYTLQKLNEALANIAKTTITPIKVNFSDMNNFGKQLCVDSLIKETRTIKRVIFNDPATIIFWNDGTKTVVKVQDGEKYDKERGFLFCYLKGIVGNKTLLKELEKWVGKE